MTCSKCSRSAVGIALDGQPYCEACISWKAEMQQFRDARPRDAKGWPEVSEKHLDRIILREVREEKELLREVLEELHQTHQHRIKRFEINQENSMALLPIAPGNSPVFTATPVPATSAPSTPPTWSSSDTTNAPITVDATGLIASVVIPTTAVVGTSFTLTISYTNADGTVATGTTTQTIVAPASPDITSFTIEQTF